jgi:hypothetical protein
MDRSPLRINRLTLAIALVLDRWPAYRVVRHA